ncbi:hypothetical protein R6Q59_011272 [Mikania micrantha]
MKNIFAILVPMVTFYVILEVSASRPYIDDHKLLANMKSFISHGPVMNKNSFPQLDVKEQTKMDTRRARLSDVTESDEQNEESSTDTHHYFACAKQTDCNSVTSKKEP